MAPDKLTVHIPPEASPENVIQLIRLISVHPEQCFPTVRDLLEFAGSAGIGSRTEMQIMATDLGLLMHTDDGIVLSDWSKVFIELRESIQGDILHFLIYTGWNETDPLDFLPAWTYQISCDHYWDSQTVQLEDGYLNQRVEETINEAEQAFHALGIHDFAGVSFSRKSINGLHKWLEAVNPPVIENGRFSRRAFCPPELLLLALGHVLRNEDTVTGTDVLLSREKREAICRICLLDPNVFDRALDWMIPIFPKVISLGTTAGFYGRFVRMHKIPTLSDIVR